MSQYTYVKSAYELDVIEKASTVKLINESFVNPTLSGNVSLPSTTTYGGTNIGTTLATKANLSNPTFSGAAGGITVSSDGGNAASHEPLIVRRPLDSVTSIIMARFQRGLANTSVGSIYSSSTATVYNTASDYRLKNVVGEITNASNRLLALKPIRFSWKSTGEIVDGFLAHDAQAVVPEAVTGLKDAVDTEGNPEYQGIDQSKMVPLIVAALQDAIGRIETLEAALQDATSRIALLENV